MLDRTGSVASPRGGSASAAITLIG